MGSKKTQTVGYRYYIGLHFGVCHGPVDEVQEVKVGDRRAWLGIVGDNTTIPIGQAELFGGDKKEGGVVGSLDILMGAPTQPANDYLISRISAAVPAFRGILSAVWRGGQLTANNPYVKPWAFRVKRIREGWGSGGTWYPAKAEVGLAGLPTIPVGETDTYSFTYPTRQVGDAGYPPGLTGGTVGAFPGGIGAYRPPLIPPPDSPSFGPETFTVGPYSQTVEVRMTSGFTPDDYLVVSGQTFNANQNAATPIPTGTLLKTLVAGEVMTLRILNTFDPFAAGATINLTVTAIEPGFAGMNPAHIVYQCLTNTAWGMGYPTTTIDEAAFTAAADRLFDEGFGLCMVWNQQDTLENFIRVVLDHAGGILYVDPTSGKFALKLIRDDYDREDLPLFGPSNLVALGDFQRQAWGETVNELTVVYRDVTTNKDAAVTIQDLANIQTQGGVVAQVRQYPGLPIASLAQRVAQRDLNTLSTPLAKVRITATRAAWALIPGDVFRLSWPDYDLDDVVFRVLEVNRGTLQNGTITIEAVEDVFALPTNTYVVEQPPGWVEPTNEPAAAPFRKLVEAPYWDLARNLTAAELDYVDNLAGYLQTLAVRPSGDALGYEINARVGAAAYEEKAIGQFCPSATLAVAITKTTTAITLAGGVDLDLVVAGGYALLGDEVVGISAIDDTAGTATITRGLLDTVPVNHAAGERIFFADGFQGVDPTEYADGEVVSVKLLPRTGLGELLIDLAPQDTFEIDRRQSRPYPPGKVLINGLAYPDSLVDVVLAFTWAHRNRLQQTATLITQDAASIGPEPGTVYNLQLFDTQSNALIDSLTGTAGTSWTPRLLRGLNALRIEIQSALAGVGSYQIHVHPFTLAVDMRTQEDGEYRETQDGITRMQE
ncbi:MAG: phage tail protein [Steroidobacteraceae bacterium]